jgi:glycosyl hydrolase family 2
VPGYLRAQTVLLAASAVLAAPAAAQQPAPPLKVERPTKKTYVREGASGRYLLGGTWYFRPDDAFVGDAQRFWAQRSLSGWTPVKVPSDWNATDTTLNRPTVGWYRKEFKLPRVPRGRHFQWKLRFESVNHRAIVWLNGRKLAVHSPGYLPFEVDLKGLRRGRNHLVVKVSTLRGNTDLTHWRAARFNGFGSGGWWNFGGISREVYLRRIEGVDVEDLAASPRLRCVHCAAKVRVKIRLRNMGRSKRTVGLFMTVGKRRIPLPSRDLDGGATRDISTGFTISKPRLWRPGQPSLYDLRVSAFTKGRRRASFYRAFGVRKLSRTKDGRVLLNGHRLQLRGASIHEDDPRTGAALTPRQRSLIVSRIRSLHATVVRAQYPIHPAFLEAFDRLGILFWDGAPVYQPPNVLLNLPKVRRNAVRVNRDTVFRDRSHPSVIAWSLGNELASGVGERGLIGPGFARFIRAGARAVRELDPTRLVAIDRQSRVGEPLTNPAFRYLSALGVHDYFGWYSSNAPGYPRTTTADFGPYLDRLHAANPRLALFITEFGAEANRAGPETEKGTTAFQARWLEDHLGIYKARRYLNGAMVWILKDFRVNEVWNGGNPKPTPPWNKKGLIDQTGARKPAFFALARVFRHTKQLR